MSDEDICQEKVSGLFSGSRSGTAEGWKINLTPFQITHRTYSNGESVQSSTTDNELVIENSFHPTLAMTRSPWVETLVITA